MSLLKALKYGHFFLIFKIFALYFEVEQNLKLNEAL